MGDTHIATLDGVRYDFQVVGEYTLVRSTKDDFAVQVRQVPAKQSRTVTVNQAMATKIGGRRVTIAVENGAAILRVDGTPVTDSQIRFSGGAISQSSTMAGVVFLLEWSDGTTVRVEQLGARALNVKVKPADARKGMLVGLLGNDNGSPEDDLIGSKGAALGVHPDPDVVTHTLADAWRITQNASLFDYQPGQSTATFTDRTFPDHHVDPSKVPDRETAEKICRQAGISDRHLLDDCIIDYASTSDFLFASSYSHQQQLLALHAATTTAAIGVSRTVMMEGNIPDANAHASVPFTARAGDVVWVGNPDCTDHYMQGAILVPDGKRIGGGALCALGRIVLPATGDYTLQTRQTDNPTGAFHVPIRFVRPDRTQPTTYNSVLAGQIETRGAHDVYTFEGHAGDLLRFSGEGCDLGNLVVSVIDPNGHDSLGPSCLSGTDARLTATGKFQLVINGADGGQGSYHFVFQGAPTAAK
jgi:hypothetical protein